MSDEAFQPDLQSHAYQSDPVPTLHRLREEDPFTGGWTAIAPTRIIGRRSRFEVDLNRPRGRAVYRRPEDAWGLDVWTTEPPDDLVDRSLAQYDAFYTRAMALLAEKSATSQKRPSAEVSNSRS